MLINMELANGFHRTFLVRQKDDNFKYDDKVYIIDNELKYYNLDSRLWQLDYHENLTIPVKRKIPLTEIQKSIATGKLNSIETATNPALIEKFVTSKITESLMKGGQFVEFLKQFRFYIVVIMIVSIIHLGLFMYGSGMLSNIRIPMIN